MRILITGSQGQLGRALHALRPEAHGVGHAELDVTDHQAVLATCQRLQPELIVHCAAWTAVDDAAKEPEKAYRVNSLGTLNMVRAAWQCDAAFVYISSNEVFDGAKSTPYLESDLPNPNNVYGQSKWAGECMVKQHLQRFFIVRTSWLTAATGRNFVHRIVQAAHEKGRLRVVTDEVACPTFVDDLAPAIWRLANTGRHGIYHLVNEGSCSRFEFARAILALTGRDPILMEPITLKEFDRPSVPPHYSALANIAGAALGITLPRWEIALAQFLRAHPPRLC